VKSTATLLAASGLSRNEARLLLAAVLGAPIESLVAHPEQAVDADTATRFADLCVRRVQGEPIAYLLGEKEFYGRRFAVSPAVLVPRPETELLIAIALTFLQGLQAPRVLDLGTGSGCIAITLALECPAATVLAVDRSAESLAVARANARQLDARVEFLLGDWYANVRGRFEVIVANPPYVAADDPHLSALQREPLHALAAGADGLADLRHIVAGAPARLNPGGWLAVEHGHDQGGRVRELFARAGFADIETHRDLAGIERVCVGTLAAVDRQPAHPHAQ
jgi:release factor glutamine methyltransferase